MSTIEDTAYEGNEYMWNYLSSPTNGATKYNNYAKGTILNDDPNITYVRNSAGTIQSGFTETQNYIPQIQNTIYKTWDGSTLIHSAMDPNGFCETNVQPASGYSWTGNGCEMRVD